MNRRTYQFRGALEPVVKDIFGLVAIGGTGAPTLTTSLTLANSQTINPSKGISSVTRNGAGDYTIALQDSFIRLLQANAQFKVASGVAAAPDVTVRTDNSNSSTAPSIRLVFSAAGTPTDPASGETMMLALVFSDSTAP